MKLSHFVFSVLLLSAASHVFGDQPNIVFILADDVNYDSIGCYGGENVATPNIDRLAKQGMKFERAYSAMAMCAPFRAELYTGLYPIRNGVASNHSSARPRTRSVCQELGSLGYDVALVGKKHASPQAVFPFQTIPKGKGGQLNWDGVSQFVNDGKKPFCLFVCSSNAHAPWTQGDSSNFDPNEIKLLPTQHDNPKTREVMTRYYAEVAALDEEVGKTLEILKDSGKAKDTLVIFCSEQGWALGFSKWSNWNTGIHTAFVARWPGMIEPSSRTNAMIQMADVLPTFVDIAGGSSGNNKFDGSSFLKVLIGDKNNHRDYVYGVHNNVPEGSPYPIRSIRNEQFHLLLNLSPESEYHEKHVMIENSRLIWWQAMNDAAARGDEVAKKLVAKYRNRPEVELYRVDQDTYEMENLAGKPEFADVESSLLAELARWMKSQRDAGAELDSKEGRELLSSTPFSQVKPGN